MKTFWILALLSAGIGTAAAWSINQGRYGYRDSAFGPFKIGGEVTPDNIPQYVNMTSKKSNEKGGKVAVQGDTTFDFGVMRPGEEGEHLFRVRNEGEGNLTLRLGASTCKCTLGELQKDSLAPGEETDIKLSWQVKPGSDEFGQSAQILTNDPTMVAITLKITGKVIEDFQLVPDQWTFGEVVTDEPFEIKGKIYNYKDTKIKPTELRFTSEELNKLTEFDVHEMEKSEYAEGSENATQAFSVTARVKPGMRQGDLSQNLLFGFTYVDAEGNAVSKETVEIFNNGKPGDAELAITVPVLGRVVGTLRMLESSKLTRNSGMYVYDFGRLGPEDSLIAKTFVVLKGDQRDNTTLTIGKTSPEGVIKATLGEPKGRGSMALFPLEIELVPGEEPIERLGKDSADYGSIWIESDNPKVSRMRVVLKFAIEGR